MTRNDKGFWVWAIFVAWWWIPVKWTVGFPFSVQAHVNRMREMNAQLTRIEEAIVRLGDVLEDQPKLAAAKLAVAPKPRARKSA